MATLSGKELMWATFTNLYIVCEFGLSLGIGLGLRLGCCRVVLLACS